MEMFPSKSQTDEKGSAKGKELKKWKKEKIKKIKKK
jgi:hypothetical protein